MEAAAAQRRGTERQSSEAAATVNEGARRRRRQVESLFSLDSHGLTPEKLQPPEKRSCCACASRRQKLLVLGLRPAATTLGRVSWRYVGWDCNKPAHSDVASSSFAQSASMEDGFGGEKRKGFFQARKKNPIWNCDEIAVIAAMKFNICREEEKVVADSSLNVAASLEGDAS
ncbi:unnamed protein product [Linum tenue]|uniref:Uncharacterized protein n=1 Tax=Linum tenue TaxID=586396 RepID=A0AAV0KZ67_9ROSI|nr:unnamed protein product [Linum tenue]